MSEKRNPLSEAEKAVIIEKGTERPFTGKYNEHFAPGYYLCKQCDTPLYRSEHKFASHCGWPSFDNEIPHAVKRVPDADGQRTEIVCTNCDAHLGHVFEGEYLTPRNLRHCVNSISLRFVSQEAILKEADVKKAYFAGGCFWGVEHLMQQEPGVISVRSGYMGGYKENPSYEEVCRYVTGHVEAVEVTYDANAVSFETLAKLFFEIHDPTQTNGQGPDLGPQYLSMIFYHDASEKEISENLIQQLTNNGLDVATQVKPMVTFWPAEDYHQDYYDKNGQTPYCHQRKKRF